MIIIRNKRFAVSDEEFKALADSTAENDASELRSYDPSTATQATPGK
jgi:hypothetical protein